MTDFPEMSNWAVIEFVDADLGDLRRTQHLIHLAHVLAQMAASTMCPCKKIVSRFGSSHGAGPSPRRG